MTKQKADSERSMLMDILHRLMRIESRLCQLMYHEGCVPDGVKNVQERKPDNHDSGAD